MNSLKDNDLEIYNLIQKEKERQQEGFEMIASENIVSDSVIEAQGSILTNKYSEGYPGKRYYGGNEVIDEIEILCQKRALCLFKLDEKEWGVNVQPYSGSPANLEVYNAILRPHDRIMGLDLPSGGHLSHGFYTNKKKVSATSIFYESLPYKLNKETELIDYDELEKQALNYNPKILILGYSAYPRDLDYERVKKITDKLGCYLMMDMAHISGLVATQELNNPFEYCDIVTTTTHKTLRGPRSGLIFFKKEVTIYGEKIELTQKINDSVFPGLQGGPHNHIIAAVSVALKEANTPEFKQYIIQVKKNAKYLGQLFTKNNYKIVTNGTDNHLILWDLRNTGISGNKMEKILEYVGISVNKNTILSDKSAFSPNGIRIGLPAVTTRGLKERNMEFIFDIFDECVEISKNIQNNVGKKLKDFIKELYNNKELQKLKLKVKIYANIFRIKGKYYI